MAYDQTFETDRYTIKIDAAACHGYFEHKRLGEDSAGGLWFERNGDKLELIDYDGTFELPAEVVAKLRDSGFILDEDL